MAAKMFHQLLGAFLTILVLQPLVAKSRPVELESTQTHEQGKMSCSSPGGIGGSTSGGLFHLDVDNPLSSGRWYTFPVTYGFRSGTVMPPGLDVQTVSAIIDVAFVIWKAAVPVPWFAFQRITPGDNATIKITFAPLSGNYYGTGFYPPDGSLYLDNNHTLWGNTFPPASNQLDLLSGVLNIIGYTLGLEPSADPASVMYPTLNYGSIKWNLSPEDISRIQNLYLPHLELAKPI
ncbi:hypothetical protein HRI_003550000 [Hibiscus trionum]|uniref:Peptidase M10 metallopeptidase domain-containing protein n=1 Tax=Hibiscus trionum TaxID=183268 RepID=A0A9W7MCK8_HIBTR|nr:hypothetical protein HRI_003550000 [Hibiscus trionum]